MGLGLGEAFANAVAAQNAAAEMPAARFFALLAGRPDLHLRRREKAHARRTIVVLVSQNGAVALTEFARYEYKYSS